MGIWMIVRRRWRTALWMALTAAVLVNVFVFVGIPRARVGGSDYSSVDDSRGHLQVIRKRLNKSFNNSSKESDINGLGKNVIGQLLGLRRRGNDDNDEDDAVGPENPDVGHTREDMEDESNNAAEQNLSGRGPNRQAGGGDVGGARANYSLPEVDEFVRKFEDRYESTMYSLSNMTKYQAFLDKLNSFKKKGARLPSFVNNKGKQAWERFHYGIHQHYLYDPQDVFIKKMISDMQGKPIVDVEQKEGGTQIKLIITFDNDGQALFKPMRFPREQETLPDHFYFADYERHNAEIAAFHLDMVMGFHRVPPTVGRWMNVTRDVYQVCDSKLAKTFFVSPAGNWCFHGSCSYYCDSSHPVCGHPVMLEGSMAAFLPSFDMAKRKTWRNPWKRSYSKHRKAYWEVYDDLCEKVKTKHPYSEGRRLLDVLDMSVFDFLTGNLDRHHYETFQDFGNNTFLLHLDNGRAFGKSKYDCISCLAPVRQCCMIRLSTLAKLVKLYIGPESLSQVMRSSLTSDLLNPIILEAHLDALDRRLSKILHVINGCIRDGKSWTDVIVDDGIT